MEFRILGPLEVSLGNRLLPLGGTKQRALLAILILNANRVVSTERLIDDLWGEEAPDTARNAVQVYVSQLRRLLNSVETNRSSIETRPPGYMLVADADSIDLERFRALATQGREGLRGHEVALASELLRTATRIPRGEPLADLKHEPFAQAVIAGLQEELLVALEDCAEADIRQGNEKDVVPELEVIVQQHPYRERLQAHLMLALYRSGRQADALEVYHEARERFGEELGIDPGKELRDLYEAILRQDAGLDLAERRAARSDDGPSPTTLNVTRTELPRQPTSFLGREDELVQLTALLRRDDVRLVTITGPGGSGKTRLALRAAEDMADELEGSVWFVPLASINDASLIASAIATAMGVLEVPGTPLEEILVQRLRSTKGLLLLDNVEQLLAGAGMVADLIARTASVRVLATSRASLRIAAEHVYPLGPLEIPSEQMLTSGEDVASFEAVALFIERASAVTPGFELLPATASIVGEICRRLDGLPLAIELAAARTRLVTAGQLLRLLEHRLDVLTAGPKDAPKRHQTLRATLDWSYDLLDPSDRNLFAYLSVFAGGCTIEEVHNSLGEDEAAGSLLDALESLIENSLVRREEVSGESRLVMLETIREYASERLREQGHAEEALAKHAEYFAARGLAAKAALRGPEQRLWLKQLDSEQDNVRAAISHFLSDEARVRRGVQLIVAMKPYWEARGYWQEAHAWIDRALALTVNLSVADQAPLLLAAGSMAGYRGALAEALDLLSEAVTLARDAGDDQTLALALTSYSWARVMNGQPESDARPIGEEGVRLARQLGDPWVLSEALNHLGGMLSQERHNPESVPLFEEALDLSRQMGDERQIAVVLSNLGWIWLMYADYQQAAAYLEESAGLARQLKYRPGVITAENNLALVHLLTGSPPRAEPIFLHNLRVCHELRDLPIGEEALLGLAAVRASTADWTEAAWLAGASEGVMRAMGSVPDEVRQRIHDQLLSKARAALGEGAFDEEVERGRRSSFDEAVERALARAVVHPVVADVKE